MGAEAAFVLALGSVLILGFCVVAAFVLCRKAMQRGAWFESEIKTPSVTFCLRTGSTPGQIGPPGSERKNAVESSAASQTHAETVDQVK